MRIVGGSLKGRPLQSPKGMATRPTTDRTRESLFNILTQKIDFEICRTLDLFAGTGALGGNIGTLKPFDLVFADPPYRKGFGEKAARSLKEGGWLNPDATLVLEEATDVFPEGIKGYHNDWDLEMNRFFISLLVGFFAITTVSVNASEQKPTITEFTLENGLRLVVIPDRRMLLQAGIIQLTIKKFHPLPWLI